MYMLLLVSMSEDSTLFPAGTQTDNGSWDVNKHFSIQLRRNKHLHAFHFRRDVGYFKLNFRCKTKFWSLQFFGSIGESDDVVDIFLNGNTAVLFPVLHKLYYEKSCYKILQMLAFRLGIYILDTISKGKKLVVKVKLWNYFISDKLAL